MSKATDRPESPAGKPSHDSPRSAKVVHTSDRPAGTLLSFSAEELRDLGADLNNPYVQFSVRNGRLVIE